MRRLTTLLTVFAGLSCAATPVETHGWLSVSGNKVVDEHGNPAALRGMSLFWSQWAPKFWNSKAVSWLTSDWKISVIRCPMAIQSAQGGYLETDSDVEVARVDSVVQAAIAQGIYAIIDWHEETAVNHTADAVRFFSRMSAKYAAYPNVLYEIYNEPNNTISWSQVKDYASQVIPAIRANSPKALVIVGNPSWDQDLPDVVASPLSQTNVAYTLHFYAASMKQWLRDRGNTAMNAGLALFVTEWGTCESTGDGTVDVTESDNWISWMESNGISWDNWSIETKSESCAALNGTASGTGGWSTSDLTTSGSYVRSKLRALNAGYTLATKDTFAVPGTVDASMPSATTGTQVEADSIGSGNHLAYIDSGTAADYLIKASKAGNYSISLSAAGAKNGGTIAWSVDGASAGSTSVAGTGGWQSWQTTRGPSLALTTGIHTIHLSFLGSGTGLFNLKTIVLSAQDVVSVTRQEISQGLQLGTENVTINGGIWKSAILLDAQGRELSRRELGSGAVSIGLSRLHGHGFLRLTGDHPLTVPVVSIR